jgi:hypothetical protein
MNNAPLVQNAEKTRSFQALQLSQSKRYVRVSGSLIDDVVHRRPASSNCGFWYSLHAGPGIARFDPALDAAQRGRIADLLTAEWREQILHEELELDKLTIEVDHYNTVLAAMATGAGPSSADPKYFDSIFYNLRHFCDTSTWLCPGAWTSQAVRNLQDSINAQLTSLTLEIKIGRRRLGSIQTQMASDLNWVSITETTVTTTTIIQL